MEMLTQVPICSNEKRVSYWALKRRFDLDDDYLEVVKDEPSMPKTGGG